jgi:hypothetical protein
MGLDEDSWRVGAKYSALLLRRLTRAAPGITGEGSVEEVHCGVPGGQPAASPAADW